MQSDSEDTVTDRGIERIGPETPTVLWSSPSLLPTFWGMLKDKLKHIKIL